MLGKYLKTKKEIIKKIKVFPRDKEIKFNEEFINVIIGPRRSGKSYFLYDIIKNKLKLKEDEYLFVNFEEIEVNDLNEIITAHVEIYGREPKYLFLDEIQSLKNWEKQLYSLYEQKQYVIFVTGSNSKLLSKEIATQLRGRSKTIKIFPFSFKEIFEIYNLNYREKILSEDEIRTIRKIINKHIYTQYPQIVLEKIEPWDFFNDYLDLVIFKDIIERYNVENRFALNFLVKNLIDSSTKVFSVNKLYKTLKSQNYKISKNTLYDYLEYLEDTKVFLFIRKYTNSLRKQELVEKKVYPCDPGIYNYLKEIDIGKTLEMVVLCELIKRNYDVYYYVLKNSKEIDFLWKYINEIGLVEVCYSFDNFDVKKDHINKVFDALCELNLGEGLIVTWNHEETIVKNGKTIRIVPFWKFLINILHKDP
jgi:predicted AAA+ superfamily ATPase